MREAISCVSDDEANDSPSSIGPDDKEFIRARTAAFRYLSLRPRSCAEVEHKLIEKKFTGAVIHAVLADLGRLGYVNDPEFAREWARSRVKFRGFGRRRIEHELKAKNISPDIIHETLCALFADSSEENIARREAEKKLKALSRFGPEIRRRRLAGFLERKGFPSDIIRRIITEAISLTD